MGAWDHAGQTAPQYRATGREALTIRQSTRIPFVYPILGFVGGRTYPAAPTFGLPCPTTTFTLGLLLWASAPVPRSLLVIPSLWVVVGTSAALQLGVPEDFGLLGAGILTTSLMLPRRRQARMA